MKFEVGCVYQIDGVKYVLVGSKFKEDWNTGGTGTHYYDFTALVFDDDFIERTSDGLFMKTIKIKNYISIESQIEGIKKLDETSYEVKKQEIVKYTLRKKTPKTITVYE